MPSNPENRARSNRDSWPPTQVVLKPTLSTKEAPLPSLDDIDNDPLTYFLTPAPDIEDDDFDDAMMMDFDAGIEDSTQPRRDVVRSVSPSTLDGLRKPGLRPVSPDTCSEATASDCDMYDYDCDYDEGDDDAEDHEDYIRFSPGRDGMLNLRGASATTGSLRPRSPVFGSSHSPTRISAAALSPGVGAAGAAFLSPASSFPAPSLRGRGRGGMSRSMPVPGAVPRRRTGQLWREPSPDVWSIEEETEEELGVGSPSSASSGPAMTKAGKPKKKVRFALPAQMD